MNKKIALIIGTAAGATVGFVVNYLFGASSKTTFDEQYRSRWDQAVEDGFAAAEAHEIEMRRQLMITRRPNVLPPTGEI